ncbi:MAG: insulinase family protein [Caldilineaceae bacterium]|nr:insulinase family protein [Caldilineaceae bacterium]
MRFAKVLSLILATWILTSCYLPETMTSAGCTPDNVLDCLVELQEGSASETEGETVDDVEWPLPSTEFLETFDPAAPFPLDPVVMTGRLDNGLTWYIAPNDDPPDRARIALAVGVGSLHEDDDQLGVAHFLEHMLFNGTENFTQEEMRRFFEANGMTMGPHVNAGTSFERTTYYLDIDTSNQELMDNAFVILGDWAMRGLLEQEEIDKEKGVVEEEWRLATENASGRIQKRIFEVVLAGSRYADRDVIGDMDIINGLTSETVRRFYEDWYRPDLMTVVVTGSVNPEWVEARIREQFGAMRMPQDARPSPESAIMPMEGMTVAPFSDPEFPFVSAQVFQLVETEPFETLGDARRRFVESLAQAMLNERLDRISREPDSAFQYAGLSSGELGIGGVSLASLYVQLAEDKALLGFEAALTNLRQAMEHGFTDGELHRAKLNLLEAYASDFEALETRRNRQIQGGILSLVQYGDPFSGIAFEYDLAKHYIPTITLADVDAYIANALDVNRSLILWVGPDKDDFQLPDEAAVLAAVEAVGDMAIAAYEDDSLAAGTALMDVLPEPVAWVTESYDERTDVTVLTWANGATALLKPTDLTENEVLLDLSSPGGLSLIEDADYFAAQLVTTTANESGAGPFDYDDLEQLLAGQTVRVWTSLGGLSEGYGASADTDDIETLFQLMYLSVLHPRFDEDAFQNAVDDQRVYLENLHLDPLYHLIELIDRVLYDNSTRERFMQVEDLDAIEFADAVSIHEARFGTLDNPVVVMAGDFELEAAKRLLNTYIGSLPTGEEEAWTDRTVDTRQGPYMESIRHGIASQVFVYQVHVDRDLEEFSDADLAAVGALSKILDSRYTDELREQMGGTYGVSASVSARNRPGPSGSFSVFFGTNEEDFEAMRDASKAIMNDILDAGVTQEEVDAAKAQLTRDLENRQTRNWYWIGELEREFLYGDRDLALVDRRQEYIDAITAEHISAMAALLLKPNGLVELMQLPEASEE